MAKKNLQPAGTYPVKDPNDASIRKLNREQMKFIDDNANKYDTYKSLIEDVWALRDGEKAKGFTLKHNEGKVVKEYCLQKGYVLKAIHPRKAQHFSLTDEQMLFIDNNYTESSMALAKALFPDLPARGIALTAQKIAIDHYKKQKYGDTLARENFDGGIIRTYKPPGSLFHLVPRVNKYCHKDFKQETLNRDDREALEKILEYINNIRFKQTVENYESDDDREIVESSLINLTMDKPDLTNSELSQYIVVCECYVAMARCQRVLDKLRREQHDMLVGEQKRVSEAMAKNIDQAAGEYDKAAKRAQDIIKNLEGTRNERMRNSIDKNKSLLALVEAMQKEDGRKKLIHLQKLEKMKLKGEIDRFKDVGFEIAKIMGLSEEECL